MPVVAGRDVDWQSFQEVSTRRTVPCAWLESNAPSYILYTSGTTGRPKGVQRDVGGYAVALAASMKHIFCGEPGETMFTTSDIGWVVGHSYIIYAPLIAGMTTILYEGVPIRPDAGIWWQIVQDHKVSVMFSAPTAIRVLKKQDPAYLKKYDLSSLKHLFLAGEPLDEPTHVLDQRGARQAGHRPLLADRDRLAAAVRASRAWRRRRSRWARPASRCYGYDLRLLHESSRPAGGERREGRGDDRAAAAARLHDDGVGRRRALRRHLFQGLPGPARLLDLRLGHPRRGRLLLHPRAYRRRHQRRRPPPRHAGDRGGGQHASQHRRMRGRRGGRPAEGADAARLRRGQGFFDTRSSEGGRRSKKKSWKPWTSSWARSRGPRRCTS